MVLMSRSSISITGRNPFVVERLQHLLRRQSVGEQRPVALHQRLRTSSNDLSATPPIAAKDMRPFLVSLFTLSKKGLTEGER